MIDKNKKEIVGYGALGWPLIMSTRYKGETCLLCPRCESTDIQLGCTPGYDGRMFSPGTKDYILCLNCGMKHSELSKL